MIADKSKGIFNVKSASSVISKETNHLIVFSIMHINAKVTIHRKCDCLFSIDPIGICCKNGSVLRMIASFFHENKYSTKWEGKYYYIAPQHLTKVEMMEKCFFIETSDEFLMHFDYKNWRNVEKQPAKTKRKNQFTLTIIRNRSLLMPLKRQCAGIAKLWYSFDAYLH